MSHVTGTLMSHVTGTGVSQAVPPPDAGTDRPRAPHTRPQQQGSRRQTRGPCAPARSLRGRLEPSQARLLLREGSCLILTEGTGMFQEEFFAYILDTKKAIGPKLMCRKQSQGWLGSPA